MSLQDLPLELTERVVVLLPLSDINSLRLTNKCLASKATQKHFKASFLTKRVELTEQQLRSFVAVTASGGLGCLLKDLTLVAPVYDTLELIARLKNSTVRFAKLDEDGHFEGNLESRDLTEDEVQQTKNDLTVLQERHTEHLDLLRHQKDVELLSQAFSNLAANGTSLRMVRIEVAIYKDDAITPILPLFGGSWRPIWSSAANVSRALFASLASCDLPIQSLDLFNTNRMVRCSLSCNELDSVDFASGSLDSSLSHLKELSLSISDRFIDQRPGEEDQSPEEEIQSSDEETSESSSNGLQSLLQTCPDIQRLDLAHYSLKYVDNKKTQYGSILQTLGASSLPRLQHLALQDFKTTEDELLALLQGFGTLRNLSLRYIRLLDGSYKPILDYCSMEAVMENVELHSLFGPKKGILFEPPWIILPLASSLTKDHPTGYPRSRASYRRSSDTSANYEIKHHVHSRRSMDSPRIRAWSQDLRYRFGPPGENGRTSCLQPHVDPEKYWAN